MSQVERAKAKGMPPIEQSGCMFLALKAVATKKPGQLVRQTAKNLKFCCNKSGFGEMHFLCNLVDHEASMDYMRRLKQAIRSVMLLECLEVSGYFEGDDCGPEDRYGICQISALNKMQNMRRTAKPKHS